MLMNIMLFVEENIGLQLNYKYYNTIACDQERVLIFHLDFFYG